MVDSTPDGALDPQEAFSQLESRTLPSEVWDDYWVVPDFAHAATVEDIELPVGTKYEVTFLVRDITTETEQVLPSDDLPDLDTERTPTTFEEGSETYVVSRDREPCEECSGDGVVECYTCGGDGFVSCPRSECDDGILKETCGCDWGEIARECGNCDDGKIPITTYEDGREVNTFESCDVCRGSGELTDTCPRCGGDGKRTIGECSRCTQSDPVGMVDCDACEASDHTAECRSCDGHGYIVCITREHHEYRIHTETACDTDSYWYRYFVWEDTPQTVSEDVDLSEFEDISQPDGNVVQTRLKEYKPDQDRAYKFKYSVDIEYDLPSYDKPLTAYVMEDSVSGDAPKRADLGLIGKIKVLIGLDSLL